MGYPNETQVKGTKIPIFVNRVYALSMAVSFTFLTFGLLFVRYAGNLSREETIGYIREATMQTKYAIEEYVREEFDILRAAAIVAQDRDLQVENMPLRQMMRALSSHKAYTLIGYAGADGQAFWFDRQDRQHHADFSNEEFFSRALGGENTISDPRYDRTVGHHIHYYAVPIYAGEAGAARGVVFAAALQDELRNVINRSLYAGKGLAHIIESNGDYVVESESTIAMGIGNNIFEIPEPLDENVKQDILRDLRVGRAGYFEKSIYGENRLVAYAPLAVNEWHIFYVVPAEMVQAGLRNVTFGSAVVVSVATGVFVLLILLIRRVNNKNRKVLEHLAFVDPVTGRRNYQKFLLDAAEVLKNANGTHYAVCYSDIKGFKYVNDLFGRDVGDRMLRYWADLQDMISLEGEVSCRLGGDTFVALRQYRSRRGLEQRFKNHARRLAAFPETFTQGYKAELYAGAYAIDPADGELTLNDMLDRAIAAQKEVKQAGGTKRFCFYSKEMREEKLWEAELESRMEAALENREFKVYLQPKVGIQEGNRILGAEALVRWDFPGKGMLLPGQFIELFERDGFISTLDKYVFETVCTYYKETFLGKGKPSVILSVNVSRLSLMQPDFVPSYTAIREACGIPPGCIELEFTEGLAFRDHVLFKRIVAACRRSGFLCSMDDFGSGYSSLNMLKSIYVDVLKLDKQFFLYGDDAERGRKLVKNIISMAKSLNMKTVAEGVEEETQVEQLRAMGCDAVQGYVFSKPVPMERFGALLARPSRVPVPAKKQT